MDKNKDFNHDSSEEFGEHISKLLTLLKKALRNSKINQEEMRKIFGEIRSNQDQTNVNLFFLTFMPMPSDEWDEMESELEEIFDEAHEAEHSEDDLKFEISNTDEEFLKKHGLKF